MPKQFHPQYIPYSATNFSTKIIADYVNQAKELTPFFLHAPAIEGIEQAISHRQSFSTDRHVLVNVLAEQYAAMETSPQVKKNIDLLASTNTFTICTAHQPNIFTGHLYFIYKILHTIKLAEYLNDHLPQHHFVPVFYMGSEDADLEELGHIFMNGQKYEWQTKQSGAVGKMLVDEALLHLLEEIGGQLTVLPFGLHLMKLLKNCYVKGSPIQQATFTLINALFREYGLVVLLPDNAALKRTMLAIFEDDIYNGTPCKIVDKTSGALSSHYKVQAHPREINLFYLKDNIRSRIIEKNKIYHVEDADIHFNAEEMRVELNTHPERFSPNVILRGLYQETILPNLAFVGGGGELAYWLELKDLFQHYNVPYPVLILRNSFMLIDKKVKFLYHKLKLDTSDLFKKENTLMNELVKKESTQQLLLTLEKQQVSEAYDEIKKVAQQIDSTLTSHAEALRAKALQYLDILEKKMLKAEKRKFEVHQRQLKKIKSRLFPNNELQERVENFLPYYALYGKDFIAMLYENSLIFQQNFCVLTEVENVPADHQGLYVEE